MSRHGIPANLKSDNGPPMNSQEFKTYTEALRIKWKPSAPLWLPWNGNAESVMKPIGTLMKACDIEGKPWKQELQRFFLSYRTTPIRQPTSPPASYSTIARQKDKLQNKNALTNIKWQKKISNGKKNNKEYYDKHCRATESDINERDTVICLQPKRNKLTSKFYPEL